MLLNNIDNIKLLASITTDEYDAYLTAFLTMLEEWLKDYCNNKFDVDTPQGILIFAAQAIQFNMQPMTLQSRSMGSVSYSYNLEYPESMMKLLAPYRKVRFNAF